tara:strand:+ start:4656 stop:4991 length:336 start_codon:yes stop_codon:yes gene_type:complete
MKTLREKRLEFLQSIDNDINYYIPPEELDKFLTDPNLNFEKYRMKYSTENREKNLSNCVKEFKEDLNALEYFTIKNECIDEYNLENNEYFYRGDVFLDDSFYEWKYKQKIM